MILANAFFLIITAAPTFLLMRRYKKSGDVPRGASLAGIITAAALSAGACVTLMLLMRFY